MKRILLVAVILSHLVTTAQAQVNAQWRGPDRNGIFPEENLMDSWPEEGPELLFYVEDIGKGYSSAVYDRGVYYVTGMKDTLDYLTAIDAKGQVLWQVDYGRSWTDSFQDTRSTPTVDGDHIYVISGTGELVCLDLSGKIVWRVDVDQMFGAKWHMWGVSESPLVVGDLVLCTPVGEKVSMAAFHKEDGSLVWTADPVSGRRSYVSPILYEYESHKFILAMSSTDLFAVRPEDGSMAWTFRYLDLVPEEDEEDEEYEEEYEEEEDEEEEEDDEEEEDEEEYEEEEEEEEEEEGWIYTNTPVFHKNGIFLTAGYDMPAAMLKLKPEGDGVEVKYTDRTLDSHHHGVVLVDGYLYGSNWYNNSRGRWVCMKWSTGEIKYVHEWKTKGNIQYADGKLYVYEDRGTVGLVEPDKDGFEVISSFRIKRGSGPHWAHLGIYDGKLLVRHGNVLMVYDISAK